MVFKIAIIKDLLKIAIEEKIKTQITVGKKIPTLIGSKRGSLIGKAGQFPGKPKKLYIV